MLALEQCSAPILRNMVIQPIRIISMLNEPTNFCRVCGLEQPYPQYGESGRVPTFEICSCCGVEFGYEDATIAGTVRFRNAWMARGKEWFHTDKRPKDWAWERQKERIPDVFK